jgi:flagellar hook assembly protein FlgD
MRLTAQDDETPVEVGIYDGAGRLVRRMFEGRVPGKLVIEWEGRDRAGREMPSGVYFMRAEQGERTLTHRIILLR